LISKQLLIKKTINDKLPVVNEPEAPQVAPPGRSDLTEITSPMVGTFYRAAAPGEEPFVEIGNNVKVGQTICILEAMKLMNEIECEFNAEIVEILVENGTPVEFGQVLMRVKQS
jgi:acetyl-CoA carboxylase biotin carboxyl carrier protein